MTKEVQELLFRSGSFIFGMAMKQKYGNSSLLGSTAGLSSQGFYRDFLIQKDQRNSAKTLHGLKNDDMHHVNQNDLAEVAKTAKKLAKGSGNFKTLHVSKDIATEMFADSPLHLSYLSELPSNHKISLHSCGQFIDITNGPLIATSKQIKFIQLLDSSSTSLTLPPLSSSGTTPCIPLDLTRVRGIAFSSEDSLNSWTKIQDEAASRDHRVIGKDQKLFYTHPMSPGSIFMLPHGTRIVNRLLAFLRKEYRNFGYQEVVTPMLYNKDLWVKSGHWQNYKEDMFLINDQSSSGVEEKETQSAEQVEFGLKPMNCPGHCLIFASESRSYRELPIRYADFSALHR